MAHIRQIQSFVVCRLRRTKCSVFSRLIVHFSKASADRRYSNVRSIYCCFFWFFRFLILVNCMQLFFIESVIFSTRKFVMLCVCVCVSVSVCLSVDLLVICWYILFCLSYSIQFGSWCHDALISVVVLCVSSQLHLDQCASVLCRWLAAVNQSITRSLDQYMIVIAHVRLRWNAKSSAVKSYVGS